MWNFFPQYHFFLHQSFYYNQDEITSEHFIWF